MITHTSRRRNRRSLVFAGLASFALFGSKGPASADPAQMVGTWLDHTGRGAVEIVRCGESLCGYIVWMKEPLDKRGKPWLDGLNPTVALRAKPVCGLQVVGEARPQANGSLDNGWIYNPEDGGRYSVEVKLISSNVLRVHGYAGIKLLGETYTWKRAPANLGRCGA